MYSRIVSASSGRQTTRSGQPHLGLVVDQRRTVDPAGVQAGRARDGDRGGGVPLVHPAGVHVGVADVTDDRDDLGAGRAHRHEVGADLGGHPLDEGRRAGAGDHDAGPLGGARRDHRRVAGVEGPADAGLRDGTGGELAVLPQRDVHGPVVAGRLGELAGAVEGVDDPHARGAQPVLVGDRGLALLGHHRVARTVLGAERHQQVVRRLVPGVLELPALEPLAADLGQQLAGDGGRPGGEDVVVGGCRSGRDGKACGVGHPAKSIG